MKYLKYSLLIIIASIVLGCGAYSFTGVQDLGNVDTFQVNYFQNNAALVEPGLERDFKIALEDSKPNPLPS